MASRPRYPPTRRTAEGEWEVYYLAHWVPGVEPYPSFRHLMEEERRRSLEPVDPKSLSRPAPSTLRTLWRVLRRGPS